MVVPEKDRDKNNDVFDVRRIRRLVELMQDNDLAEIDLQQGDTRIQMRRNASAAGVAAPQYVQMPHLQVPHVPQIAAQPAPSAAGAGAAETAAVDESHIGYIKSPMVGTFYTSSKPGAPPFVKVGDHVHPEQTVCILEAMKVFNEIQAEMTGKIVAVLVANGEPVEFGKPLFKIDTRG
ncbi:MAG: acetyl-CoA carboxylase biotin carboxyl carrier protein [Thermoguttaceae bacterium]